MEDEFETVRSYERVFRFDRKIHRIEGWVLPVPVPLAAVGWFFLGLILSLIASALPLIKIAYTQIGAPLRFVIVPLAVAVAASQIETQGRPIHRFVISWAATRMRAGRRSIGRAVPAENHYTYIDFWVWVTRDQFSSHLHAATITGPARVSFRDRVWARSDHKGQTVTVRATQPLTVPGARHVGLAYRRTRTIELPAGATLEIQPR